ncbi:cytochrome C assembly family protein [Methylovorus mays]|uniref:cytochrome C assembly family protein n=1 Tax=Methylovorus mays TaxID=184077 RepID=UPI001E401521|nr:cytochrome c biogenesis protein CcsA [Methylovorus mays]MCB5207748.1 cytochrome c biogenesis protein CcsA [Methylovorus mays]
MVALIPFLLTALIYSLVAIDFWRSVKTSDPASRRKLHSRVLAIGLLLHAGLLYNAMFTEGLNLSFDNALSAIAWLTVLIYWVNNLRYPLQSLQAFVLPPAAFFVLLQYGMHENHVLPYLGNPLFMAHLVIAILAYSLFTFAALHAGLMAFAERKLHQKSSLSRLPEFPPIIVMEKLLFRVIALGFFLLTLTLLSGALFSEQIFGQALKFNHKNLFAIISWLVYGGLLLGRQAYGWRGKTAIRWTLSGFVILLLAYAGTKFVLEVLLNR